MKKVVLLGGVIAFLAACSNPSASSEAADAQEVTEEVQSDVSYAVNATESVVKWTGTKPTGSQHTGTVAVESGDLAMRDGAIIAGSFVLDMTTLDATDEGMDEETEAKLIGHLSTGDFFEVEKYPSASFTITGATADSLTGNLTIKDISKSISFPYTMSVEGNAVTANATFSIDRTQWGVTFNSGNFFENLGEHLINDAVQFDVALVARSGE